jgi:hypothetical protein
MRMTRTKIIHRNLTRVKQFAFTQHRDKRARGAVELLDTVVRLVRDVDVAGGFVDRDGFWFIQRFGTRGLERAAEDVTAGGEGWGAEQES